jgi:hypothetical protein
MACYLYIAKYIGIRADLLDFSFSGLRFDAIPSCV